MFREIPQYCSFVATLHKHETTAIGDGAYRYHSGGPTFSSDLWKSHRLFLSGCPHRPLDPLTSCSSAQAHSVVDLNDTIRLTILTCAQKLTSSQLNLPQGTEQNRIMKKLKPKNGDAQKKRSGREVRAEAGRESMVGKICERGRSWGWSERKRELWMVRVVSWQSEMW